MTVRDLLEQLPTLLGGLRISLVVTAFSLLLGLPLGFALGLVETSQVRWIRWSTSAVIELLRGVPLLVLVYVIYFGLPATGITLSALPALIAGVSISTGAYTSQIFGAGLLNVPGGHREAARSLGMTLKHEVMYVVIPQALSAVKLPIIAFSVLVFQGSAVGFAIGVPELLSRSYAIGSVTFDYLKVFTLAGVLYAAASSIGSATVYLLSPRSSRQRLLPL